MNPSRPAVDLGSEFPAIETFLRKMRIVPVTPGRCGSTPSLAGRGADVLLWYQDARHIDVQLGRHGETVKPVIPTHLSVDKIAIRSYIFFMRCRLMSFLVFLSVFAMACNGTASSFATAIAGSATVASTTTITASPNPASVGQSVALQATVSGSDVMPTGSVTFSSGTAILASVSL